MSTFNHLGIVPVVLDNVKNMGFTEPTEIQALAIKPSIEGRDVLGIAQTGTGKTAAFLIPLITKLMETRAKARMPRGLVLTPTRELAAQIVEFFDSLAQNTSLKKALLIGGVSFKEQKKLLDVGVDVLIGTPGRILDHLEQQNLILHGIQTVIIDEADRMLDEGFVPDVEKICTKIPNRRQTLFYSATMIPEIEALTTQFLQNPVRFEISPQASVSAKIRQIGYMVEGKSDSEEFGNKREALRRLIGDLGEEVKNAIIFCNTKNKVDILRRSMTSHGIKCTSIHGDHPQSTRTAVLESFRQGDPRFLIASDVASRGLDISFVSHVFNLDVPSNPEDYVHRIGRTGRAGKRGVAITLCGPSETKGLKAVEKLMGQNIEILTGTSDDDTSPDEVTIKKTRRSRTRKKTESKIKATRKKATPREPTDKQTGSTVNFAIGEDETLQTDSASPDQTDAHAIASRAKTDGDRSETEQTDQTRAGSDSSEAVPDEADLADVVNIPEESKYPLKKQKNRSRSKRTNKTDRKQDTTKVENATTKPSMDAVAKSPKAQHPENRSSSVKHKKPKKGKPRPADPNLGFEGRTPAFILASLQD